MNSPQMSHIPDITMLCPMMEFLTVTLQPSLYKKKCRQQLKCTMEKLIDRLKSVSNRFLLIAELTKQANIHYHVAILFNVGDFSKEYFMDTMRNNLLFGNLKINDSVIEEYDRTYNYLTKDMKKTFSLVNGKLTQATHDIWYNHNIKAEYVKLNMKSETESLSQRLDKNIALIENALFENDELIYGIKENYPCGGIMTHKR